ncbi:hypothetical protein TNCV_1299961 [Trichonephila clavipes]|nr:hypothetical protein TNCV_1299961 [Trichonephila clavipes]
MQTCLQCVVQVLDIRLWNGIACLLSLGKKRGLILVLADFSCHLITFHSCLVGERSSDPEGQGHCVTLVPTKAVISAADALRCSIAMTRSTLSGVTRAWLSAISKKEDPPFLDIVERFGLDSERFRTTSFKLSELLTMTSERHSSLTSNQFVRSER